MLLAYDFAFYWYIILIFIVEKYTRKYSFGFKMSFNSAYMFQVLGANGLLQI